MNFLKPFKFELYEWLPEDIYKKYYPIYGDNLWHMLFTYEIRYTVDRLRKRFGVTFMNDWYWMPNGNQYRGYRPLDCTVGAKLSQHKKGNAADMTFKYYKVDDARNVILADQDHNDFKYITVVEMKVPWLHIDCRPVAMGERIIKINP